MNGAPSLRIGGITSLTTIDYPGELAAVVFCQGCAWRCTYCHNDHLWPPQGEAELPWGDVLSFLARRRGLLDAVVFSGGEPTLQSALPAAMQEVRTLGFKVGLHTAGPYPHRLARVLPHVDWVGLDVKALPEDYDALTTRPGSGAAAWRSLALLLESGVAHEVRITVDADHFPPDRLHALLDRLRNTGARQVVLQPCRDRQGHACIDSALLAGASATHRPAFRSLSVRG